MTDQKDPNSVIAEAQSLVRAGNTGEALRLLQAATKLHPRHHDLHLNMAMVHRHRDEVADALTALDQTLAIEPYSFIALMSKGYLLEQMDIRAAAEVYRNAVKIAPPPDRLHETMQAPLNRAKEVVAEQSEALSTYLHEQLGGFMREAEDGGLARFEECVDIVAGKKRAYHAEPVQVHYPRLPAIPFFDREYFPWFETLENATDTIRNELITLLDAGLPGFSPYVAYAPGTPENQFAALNHSQDWSSLWLWKDGEAQPEAMAQCPKTTAILEQLPLCDQPGFAPTALFSALAPKTHIPPHTGSTNARLLVHLPLVLPGPARFRVGNEVREWRMGEAWAFDDTIEHEAWNDADETRVIMIFDIWNPLLSDTERGLVRQLLTAQAAWLASD